MLKEISLKQIKITFLEGNSPTLITVKTTFIPKSAAFSFFLT